MSSLLIYGRTREGNMENIYWSKDPVEKEIFQNGCVTEKAQKQKGRLGLSQHNNYIGCSFELCALAVYLNYFCGQL